MVYRYIESELMTTFRSPPTDHIDSKLITQIAQDYTQTHHAFAELYRRHIDRVYRYLMARTGNVQDAQDLTSQTFMAALEGISNYRGDASFAAWVLGIAQRKTADHYRRHYAQGVPIALEDVEQLAQASPTPDELVSHQLQTERMLLAVRALAPERAEAITLHTFAELSVTEVAQVMNKSEAAVRMLIHRSLNDLRTRLVEKE
jgi:RNA polymerase sigma-70 factor, ECF subfamily